MSYSGNPHEQAFLAAVHDAWSLVGDGHKPDGVTYDDKHRLVTPYVVVYTLGTSQFDGSLQAGDEQGDAWPTWQATCVGGTREQASALRDKVRTAVLGTYLDVTGRQVGPVRLLDEQPVQRDDDTGVALFYAIDRYRAHSTPA